MQYNRLIFVILVRLQEWRFHILKENSLMMMIVIQNPVPRR